MEDSSNASPSFESSQRAENHNIRNVALKKKLIYATGTVMFLITALVIIKIYSTAPKCAIVFRSNSYIFKFRFNNYGFLDIPVIIKGKKYYLTIDTGAQVSLMQNYVPGTRNDRISHITDHKGSTYSENNVTIDTVSLGAFDIAGHSFIQLNSKTGFSDGIIGMDILQYFTMKIDFRNQEIELTRASNENKTANLQKIPLKGQRNTPCINLNVDGRETTFLIDTGHNMFASINDKTPGSARTKDVVQWKGYDDNTTYRQSQESPKIVKYSKKIVDVSFLNRRLEVEIVDYYDRTNVMNLVGLDFLKRFETIILDFPNSTAYVGHTHKKSLTYFQESFRFNSIGIVFNNDLLPVITQKADWLDNKQVNVGDTIVGFYNTLLVKNVTSNVLEQNPGIYRKGASGAYSDFVKLVRRARFSDSDGQIIILKNGTILPVTLKRRKMLKPQDDYLDYYEPIGILNIPYMTAQNVRNDTSYYFIFKAIPGMK